MLAPESERLNAGAPPLVVGPSGSLGDTPGESDSPLPPPPPPPLVSSLSSSSSSLPTVALCWACQFSLLLLLPRGSSTVRSIVNPRNQRLGRRAGGGAPAGAAAGAAPTPPAAAPPAVAFAASRASSAKSVLHRGHVWAVSPHKSTHVA